MHFHNQAYDKIHRHHSLYVKNYLTNCLNHGNCYNIELDIDTVDDWGSQLVHNPVNDNFHILEMYYYTVEMHGRIHNLLLNVVHLIHNLSELKNE